MAYQFADGFDNYGNAYNLTNGYPWDSVVGASAPAVSTADFRFAPPGSLPGGCVALSNGTTYIRKNLIGNPVTIIAGFGIKLSVLTGTNQDIFQLWDTGVSQVTLGLNTNGALQFYRGALATAIGTSSPNATIVAGAWYGIQVQITINGSTGSVACYINGSTTPVINSSSLNTQATGNAFATQVSLGTGPFVTGQTIKYDDFYCFDSTTGFLNALPSGDTRILTKMPSGAGNYTNWTPTGLGSNFQNAAVQPPSTADYNANNVATTKDSYAMQSASLAVAPVFVMARASLERDDAGTHNPSLFVRSSATDSAGVATPTLTSSYLFYDAVFQNDPATSVAWTAAGADAAQVGIIEG
jgi:hypothetical protein